jgi:hypothetical protein
MKQINFSVDDRVFGVLEKHGAKHGYKPTSYAKMLFEAALASRLGVQPDTDLDEKVGAAIVLHGARQDSTTIAGVIGLSEPTVIRILDAWKRERTAA